MKKIFITLILLSISFFTFSSFKTANASTSTGLTFTAEDNYQTVKALEALPKTYEAVISVPTTVTSNPGIIYSNLGYNTFEDCYSFEIRYGNGKAYPVLYLDVDNVDSVNIDAILFEFSKVNVASGSRVQVAITLDNSNPDSTVANCYLNGSLVQTIEKTLPEEYNNLNYVPKNEGKLGGSYDGKFGSPYDTYKTSTHFTGEIYKLSLYKDTRTIEEIGQGTNIKDNDILSHYEISNSDIGKDILDKTENGYDINYSSLWIDKEPAKDYAYSFAIIGDTQSLCERHTSHMKTMYQWIVDNKENKKIEYVLGLGDITEGDDRYSKVFEWDAAKEAISLLDGVVPYSLIRGNHDTSENLNKTFANPTYMTQFNGFYKENDINASYKTLTIGENNYLFITLNYGAFDDELNWACEIIEKYPNHKVIISTHAYLYHTGERLSSTNGLRPKTTNDDDFKYKILNNSTTTDDMYNNGDEIWEKLVSKYGNIQLILSGHVDTPYVVTSQDVGIHGNTVTQMLINPQDMDKSASEAGVDGYGMVCMLYFNEDGSQMEVEYYSTVKNKYFITKNQYTVDMTGASSSAHNYNYKTNDTYHWQTCSDCDSKTKREEHVYDNSCDIDCNICGYTRDADEHSFIINKFDENHHYKVCSICQTIDETSKKPHVFDNSCDETCNNCSFERTGSHTFETKNYDKDSHWLECNDCSKVDSSSIHKHVFDHTCDKDCNECDFKRSISHDYSIPKNDGENYWNECSVCGDKLPVSAPEKNSSPLLIVGIVCGSLVLIGVAALVIKKKFL